jgi:transposase InsO family protein
MKAVADTLGVARSNLVEQAKRGGHRPRPPYCKAGDAELLARIRPLVDARPSYGYRRITALLNRQAEAEGLARVNHKRVYRVMKRAGLLLAPHTGRGRQRPHDGEVATAVSNRRWAADVFEIPCWNGDAVRVALTPTIARSSSGPPAPAGSAGSRCATSFCSRSSGASVPFGRPCRWSGSPTTAAASRRMKPSPSPWAGV